MRRMDTRSDFDISHFMPYLLNQAADASSVEFQRFYKERYGMLRTEWRVLFHLGRYGQLTAGEICERAHIHKTKISRAVAALEAKRYLTREQAAQDRRREYLHLTVTGKKVFGELLHAAEKFDADLMSNFSNAEVAILRRLLAAIAGLKP
ncbi:MAG: MarR family transcriptional regulator [Tateyamaria sp.]|uniref:MarR family winged helix-turn-helix transcriptional regulator n=3 Tax=Tateyamaria sp. TaxID=1929288 RepID=UPI00329B0531